jgi:spermidine/putrescine transport system substrate-binding protein
VVPSANYVPIFVDKGLLMEARPDQMENFSHVSARWRDVPWDPGRRYTAPWQWGTTGVAVNTSVYDGDINTSAIWLDPPEALRGKVNVVPEMSDVLSMAIMYEGGEPCTEDLEVLKKVRDRLVEAKQHWMSMDYGMTEKLSNSDVMATVNWNGSTFRARLNNPPVRYGYPKEGYPVWMDSVAVLADAQNVEEAKEFMNFIMAPENAAMISNFARYANGIDGSEEFMDPEMRDAPEIVVPAELADAGTFLPTCPPAAQKLYTAIWTELQK